MVGLHYNWCYLNCVRIQSAMNWLKIGPGRETMWTRWRKFGFYKTGNLLTNWITNHTLLKEDPEPWSYLSLYVKLTIKRVCVCVWPETGTCWLSCFVHSNWDMLHTHTHTSCHYISTDIQVPIWASHPFQADHHKAHAFQQTWWSTKRIVKRRVWRRFSVSKA